MLAKDQVVYQIYPKSFKDSDGDGFGDLKGIIEKLDYLKHLGVDMLWLTPTFISPQVDNGYDVADYRAIDPRYGTMEDMENLIHQAKDRGMGIMLDMVMNHTSTEHEWFKKALAGEKKYKDYYLWHAGHPDGSLPTNWTSKFGGSTWEYVERYNEYYLHLFAKEQADLNWDNPDVRAEMVDIIDFWMAKGVAGFRFDVINLISKPAKFIDDHQGDGRRFYTDGEHVHEYLKALNNQSFGRNPAIMTVGEMSSTTIENCVQYAGEKAQELNMVFNFHHLKVDYKDNQKWLLQPFDFEKLKQLFFSWQQGMQDHSAWMALFWNNHDQPRANSRFGNIHDYHYQVSTMLATSIHLMRGTPYIYQGEEIGMTNAYFEKIDQYRDVESLNYFDILKQEGKTEAEIMQVLQSRSRDNARTPMQWSSADRAGFSEGEPWISPTNNYKSINVEESLSSSLSIFHYYQKLIQLRKNFTIIQEGIFIPFKPEHTQILAYKRLCEHGEMIVLNNFSEEEAAINVEELSSYQMILGNYPLRIYSDSLVLKPYEALVFYRVKQ